MEYRDGMEGVVAGETRLSGIFGEQGRLVVCGRDVEALADTLGFADLCGLLWEQPQDLTAALGAARLEAWQRLDRLGDALDLPEAMDALRAGLAHWTAPLGGASDADLRVALTGALAVLAAAWWRRRAGGVLERPDPDAPHAHDYLRLLLGEAPDDLAPRASALDAYLVTVADHGFNASTFAARVVASTDSDPVSAVVAALGALKGPKHGGAPGPVLDMLEGIGRPEAAAAWVEAELVAGRRIMGMGHRVYRVRDPRAAVLERALVRLRDAGVARDRLDLAREVEAAALAALQVRHPERPLAANVEFYTAVLLDALGIPRALFTPTFAVARVAGWLGHVAEQQASGRLIRPRGRYVGPLPRSAPPLGDAAQVCRSVEVG